MADLVRTTMEAMLPDLFSFMKRKVFTKKEVKEILKTREDFEYSFLRKSSTKKDFLKAIQYEYELELKRKQKFDALKLKKQTHRDYTIVRRIIFLFDRLTSRYKHEVQLWKEYCMFCYKMRANKMFFKAVSNALSVNWDSLDIWLLAVYYHFEINKDPFKARKTFLRALKMNNNRKDFWLEYFRFELSFLEKVKQRKRISGVDEVAQETEDKMEIIDEGEEEEEEELQLHMGDEEEEQKEVSKEKKKGTRKPTKGLPEGEFISFGDDSKGTNGLKSDESDELAVMIYESVIDVFPNDSKINGELLQICNEFKGEWMENIKEEIYKVLIERYVEYPLANLYAFLEMRSLNKLTFQNETDGVIFERVNELLQDLQTYFKTLSSKYETEGEKFKLIQAKSLAIEELINQLLSHYKYLTELRNPRADLFRSIFSTILKNIHFDDIGQEKLIKIFEGICQFSCETGDISVEIKDLIKYVHHLPTSDFRVFDKLAETALKFPEHNIFKPSQLASTIRKYLKTQKIDIPHEYQASLYSHLFKLENIIQDKTKIVEFIKEATKYLLFTKGFPDFAEKFLTDVMRTYAVTEQVVSDCFHIFFAMRAGCPPGVSVLYLNKLEAIKASNPEIKKHLQKAVEWHPENKDLWLRYLDYERKHGNPLLCPDIFTRAQRHIKDGNFIHEYSALMSR